VPQRLGLQSLIKLRRFLHSFLGRHHCKVYRLWCRHIPPAGWRAKSLKAVAALSHEQVSALSPAAVGVLKPAQLRQLRGEQIAAWTPQNQVLLGLRSVA